MDPVKLALTTSQLSKFQSKQPFQLSFEQIMNSGPKQRHEVEVHLHPKHHRRFHANLRAQKGFRFHPDTIAGGSVLGSLKNIGHRILHGAKRAGSFIRKNVKKDTVKKGIQFLADQADLGQSTKSALNMAADIAYAGEGIQPPSRRHQIVVQGGSFVKGVPLPYKRRGAFEASFANIERGTRNGLLHGGSFLPLGS